jgi:hypothetical protein
MRRHSVLLAALTVTTSMWSSAAAQAQSHGRGVAILPPAESPDAPPHNQSVFIPYYSPLTPISTRWRPVYYVPYYPGYCSWHVRVKPTCGVPYGDPDPLHLMGNPVSPPDGTFGPYTGARTDEANLVHLGGNGPFTPSPAGPTDIIDLIRGGPAPGACLPR